MTVIIDGSRLSAAVTEIAAYLGGATFTAHSHDVFQSYSTNADALIRTYVAANVFTGPVLVATSYRSSGIGTELLTAAERTAVAQGTADSKAPS